MSFGVMRILIVKRGRGLMNEQIKGRYEHRTQFSLFEDLSLNIFRVIYSTILIYCHLSIQSLLRVERRSGRNIIDLHTGSLLFSTVRER